MTASGSREYHNNWYHQNKHRLAAARRRRNNEQYRIRKNLIAQRKLEAGKCCICQYPCNESNHVGFDWDHIDPLTKSFNLADVRAQPFGVIEAELAKCQLICKICHAVKSYEDKTWKIRRVGEPVNNEQLTLDL